MKKIIINADDYGRNEQINKAIAESFQKEMISDVSVMTTCADGMQHLKATGGYNYR